MLEVLFDIRTDVRTIVSHSQRRRTMASKETKKRIREEMRADQARYDATTRRLRERIERGLAEIEAQRERQQAPDTGCSYS